MISFIKHIGSKARELRQSLLAFAVAFCFLSINVATGQTAYIANNTGGNVTVVNLATGLLIDSIDVTGTPVKIAAAPNGSQIATVNLTSVSFINPATNTVISQVADGAELREVVYSADGTTVYTVDQLTTLITPYTASTQAPGTFGFLTSGVGPLAAAFNPATGELISVNNGSSNLARFTVNPLTQVGTNITVGQAPQDIVFLPGTGTAYVSSFNNNNIAVVNVAAGTSTTIAGLTRPTALAVTPNGAFIYVINDGQNNVSVINVATGAIVTTVAVGLTPRDLAVTPDGASVVVVNAGGNSLSIISTATNTVTRTISSVGNGPVSIVIVPAQTTPTNPAPVASFTVTPTSGTAPLTVTVNASASTDSLGRIVSYSYNFGDGNTATGVTATNTYGTAGTFTITLIVADSLGARDTATATITVTPQVGGGGSLRDSLQAILDTTTVTNVSGLNFGGVSAAVIDSAGNITTVVTGQATPAILVDSTLRFGAAEFSQTLLATLAFRLKEIGQLNLDAPISTYLTGTTLTNVPGTITVRQLLTQTSGLDDFSTDSTYLSTVFFDVTRNFTAAELTQLFVGTPSAVGTFRFSNTNFLVLGLVLDAANSGSTLQQSLDSLVLAPAGLTNSGIDFYQAGTGDPTDLAPLFGDVFGTGFPNQVTPNTSVFTGAGFAGNILGTPTQLLQFLQALAEGEVLSDSSLQQMIRFVNTTGRLSARYGSGIELFNLNIDGVQLPFIGVVGGINYVTAALYSREANIGVVVSTNNGVATEQQVLDLAISLLNAAIDGTSVVIDTTPTNIAPIASFTATPTSGVRPLTVNFNASASRDSLGRIVTYSYNFGNGQTGTGVTTSTTYNTAGTFTVILTVTDSLGLTDTASAVITVRDTVINRAPIANFTVTPTSGTRPLTVNFNASASTDSLGRIVTYAWNFGNGTTGTGVTTSTTYNTAGTLTVILTVTDSLGLSDTASAVITVRDTVIVRPDSAFVLQLLHASDLEGGVDAIENAPNFAAIIDTLEDTYPNTIILSAGDNFIPGPFFNAAGDAALAPVLRDVYQDFFNQPGLTGLLQAPGRIDISIMNIIGFDASAVGNHEFDAGPTAFAEVIRTDIPTPPALGTARWLGAQFPYLSSNLDFRGEPALNALYTNQIRPNTDFQSLPTNLTAARTAPKLAPATIVEVSPGQRVGVVGATTQLLDAITSNGNVEVIGPDSNNMAALAAIIQPYIDSFTTRGINKVILVSHLQQLSLERQLVGLLRNVDIIIAGGNETLIAQPGDRLRPGDVATENYPIIATNANGNPVAIVGTPGEYSYVGRLVARFNTAGVLLTTTLSDTINGVIATDSINVARIAGANAFRTNGKGELVRRLTNAVDSLVTAQDRNILGRTNFYLEGRREFVRTQQTNLGDLTADANLAIARQVDSTVIVSIKNGGGIRSSIGEIVETSPGVYVPSPPQANPETNKQLGDISQLDVVNSLRFNNTLTLVTVSLGELIQILEHGVADTRAGNTPGRFPQVSGIKFVFDTTRAVGSRIVDVFLLNTNDQPIDTFVRNGVAVEDTSRNIRVVTLNFLADGGDGYPFNRLASNRVELTTAITTPGNATFAAPGSEQDAFAEYLFSNFRTTPYNEPETPAAQDNRIMFGRRDTTVVNQAPIARFTATPTTGTAPLLVNFNASTSTDSLGRIVTYAWNFGNGQTGTGVTTSTTYTTAGTFTVILTVTDSLGLTDTASAVITVTRRDTVANRPPVANFTATPTSGTAPLAVFFNASASTDSLGRIVSYAWNFGDGSTGTGQITANTFDSAGVYTVILTVTDSLGLSDTASVVITVRGDTAVTNRPPVASFTATPTSGTAPLTVNFNASASTDSLGSIASYAWNFGNGQTGTGVTTSTVYNTDGTYTARLIVTDNGGAKDTATATITVTPRDTTGGGGNSLSDTLQTIIDATDITDVSGLKFGGVSAAVIDSNGNIITVVTGQATPAIALDSTYRLGASDITQTLLATLAFKLKERGRLNLDAPISTYFNTSSLTNVPGTITVRQLLMHTSGLDEFSNDSSYLRTILFDVTRAFTPAELTQLFVGTPSAPGTFRYANTNFLVLGLVLDAANGGSSLQQSLDSLVLAPAGLTNSGIDFYQRDTIDPTNLAPLFDDVFGTGFPQQLLPNTSIFTGASFAGNIYGTPTQLLQFLQALAEGEILDSTSLQEMLTFMNISGRLSRQYGKGIERFELNIDGVQLPFIGHIGDINYVSVALYSIEAKIGVVVQTNNGVATEAEVLQLAIDLLDAAIDGTQVRVNQVPLASIVANPTTGTAPLTVNFSAAQSRDSDGSIVSYSWNFGNGQTATGITASTTYTTNGTYRAILTVRDNDGAIDTAAITITVRDSVAPRVLDARFTATPTSGTAPLTVNFNASTSTGRIASYAWNFGNGQMGTGVTTSTTYNTAGTYTVILTVRDSSGATDTASVRITVGTAPPVDCRTVSAGEVNRAIKGRCVTNNYEATLTPQVIKAPVAPAGYQVVYILASGIGFNPIIEAISNTPSFTVDETGRYSIHTLVYNANTLNLGMIDLGVTRLLQLNARLIQGGGSICAALDTFGARFEVRDCGCGAQAGTLGYTRFGNSGVCIVGNTAAFLQATVISRSIAPAGYKIAYVLTSGNSLIIQDVNNIPVFGVRTAGNYRIHTLVYNPSTLDLDDIEFGITTAGEINALLRQGGGDICAALDVVGLRFTAVNCTGLSGGSNQASLIAAYPNPATDYININLLEFDNVEHITIEMFDNAGILAKRWVLDGYTEKTTLDLTDMQTGMYHVRISYDQEFTQDLKIVKIK